jgi:hypothetical protein
MFVTATHVCLICWPARGVQRQPVKFIEDESIAYLMCLLWWNTRCDVDVVDSGTPNLIVINHRIRCTSIQGVCYGPQGGDGRREWHAVQFGQVFT